MSSSPVRILAAAIAVHLVLMGFYHIWRYPYAAYIMLRPNRRENFIEYKIAKAVNDFHPHGRVLALGGTRFRLNSWFLLPQVGGTFESGLTNRLSIDVIYSIRTGIGVPPESRVKAAVHQLRTIGVEYIAVHGPKSKEHWRDYAWVPLPWDQMFERVWHEEDDSIYRVPFRAYSHLVRTNEIPPYTPIGAGLPYVEPYIHALDDPNRPRLADGWVGSSRMNIHGEIPDGYSVSVQISHHPAWRAFQDGSPIQVERDPIGFLLLHPHPAKSSTIQLRFAGARQQKLFMIMSGICWFLAIAALVRSLRRHPPIL